MRKIPTLFVRDPDSMSRVLPQVNPVCQWVIDGEGVATRKYDGTCVMLDELGIWWARREVKPGKPFPEGYMAEETDPNTGKTVGWEPAEQSSFAKYLDEVIRLTSTVVRPVGTYELCGPKINGNPEGYFEHLLISHTTAARIEAPRDFEGLQELFAMFRYEGLVWHHKDGRMAKLKVRDMQ